MASIVSVFLIILISLIHPIARVDAQTCDCSWESYSRICYVQHDQCNTSQTGLVASCVGDRQNQNSCSGTSTDCVCIAPTPTPIQGGCTCSMGYSRTPFVSIDNCSKSPTPHIATCTRPQGYYSLACECLVEIPGQTCGGAGDGCGPSNPCCTDLGFFCESRAGVCYQPTSGGPTPPPGASGTAKVCDFISDTTQKTHCTDCFDQDKAWTAIGCVDTTPSGFIGVLLTFGAGIAGGIAFLLILLGGFQILTSAGNPEQLNAGKELVGSAIMGLLLILFSVFILRVVGVDVLGLPDWRSPQ